MKKYFNKEMCARCKGACCKEMGCVYLPSDFESLEFDYLKGLLDQGKISISGQPFNGFYGDDWSYLLYLRARNVNSPIVDLFSKGGPCINLTDEGCSITNINERPSLGLTVEPRQIGGPCHQHYTNDFSWMDYDNVLKQLLEYYSNKSFQEVLIAQVKEMFFRIDKKLKNQEQVFNFEKFYFKWYREIMVNKPLYEIEEIKYLLKP